MPSGVVARWAHRKACVVLGVAGPVVGPAATTTRRGVCLGATTPAEWFGRHALTRYRVCLSGTRVSRWAGRVMLGMQPLDVLRTVNAAPTVAVRTHQIGNLPRTQAVSFSRHSREMRLIPIRVT